MDYFATDDLIAWAVIVGMGVLLAPIIQIVWTMRILIASYIVLGLVLLVPQKIIFASYAPVLYFVLVTFVFALIERGRFFTVSEWSVGRFSAQAFGISILLWLFIASVVCYLTPFGYMESFAARNVYDVLRDHIFYFALAPLLFTVLFSRYLR